MYMYFLILVKLTCRKAGKRKNNPLQKKMEILGGWGKGPKIDPLEGKFQWGGG